MIIDIFIICFIVFTILYLIWDYIFRFLCNFFLFKPSRKYRNCDTTFKNINKFMIKTSDNVLLDGYILGNESDIYILYAHGSSGDIYTKLNFANTLLQFGNVVMFDYRGFGLSGGSPTEYGIYNDIYTVWNFLVDVKKIEPHKIILYGDNLGCSVVSWLSKNFVKLHKQLPRAIIMQSGFTSLKDMVSDYSGFLGCFIDNQFDTYNYIKEINEMIPIMVIQNENDELSHHSYKLSLFKNTYLYKTHIINDLEFEDDLISVIINFIQRPKDYCNMKKNEDKSK